MSTISAPGRSGTDDARELIVLALNSGASPLKFGLCRDGPKHVELPLSSRADAIGASKAAFHPFFNQVNRER